MHTLNRARLGPALMILAAGSLLASLPLGSLADADPSDPRAPERQARLEKLRELDARLVEHRTALEEILLAYWRQAVEELPGEDGAAFRQLVAAARSLGSERLAGTYEEILANAPDPEASGGLSASALRRKFKRTRKDLTDDLLDEADAALKLDSGLRLDRIARALRQLLAGNSSLAKTLGLKKEGDVWMDETTRAYWKRGFVWSDEFGWVVPGEQARYEAGEYREVGSDEWRTLEDCDRGHSDPARPWDIETEHFHIRGTADLRTLVSTLGILEEHRNRVFAVLAPLVDARTRGSKDRMLLRLAERRHSSLEIYMAATRAEFETLSSRGKYVGAYYDAKQRCSMLSKEPAVTGQDPLTAPRHETTHQIFQEVLLLHQAGESGRTGIPTWAEEGLGDYFGYRSSRSRNFMAFLRQSETTRAELIEGILRAWTGPEWDALSRSKRQMAYVAALCLVAFLLEAGDGEYEGEFFSYLRRCEKERVALVAHLRIDLDVLLQRVNDWLMKTGYIK